jgi:hypothetical protein
VGNLTGLLWSQFLMFVVISVPVVALAAVTAGLASFTAASIASVALWSFLDRFRLTPWVRQFSDPDFFYSRIVPEEAQWVRYLILGLATGAAAIAAIYLQFRSRRTTLSRAFLIVIGFLGLQTHAFLAGPGFRWKVQARTSKQPVDITGWRFSVGAAQPFPPDFGLQSNVVLFLPLSVENIPPDLDVRVKRSSFALQTSNGQILMLRNHSAWTASGRFAEPSMQSPEFLLELSMSGSQYEEARTGGATLRGSLDLVVFGDERTVTIPAAAFPANVTDSFRCMIESPTPGGHPDRATMKCRAALRWPLQSVSGAISIRPDSFSPFPADLRLDPIRDKGSRGFVSASVDQHRFTLKEPVSYARVSFEIPNVLRREP